MHVCICLFPNYLSTTHFWNRGLDWSITIRLFCRVVVGLVYLGPPSIFLCPRILPCREQVLASFSSVHFVLRSVHFPSKLLCSNLLVATNGEGASHLLPMKSESNAMNREANLLRVETGHFLFNCFDSFITCFKRLQTGDNRPRMAIVYLRSPDVTDTISVFWWPTWMVCVFRCTSHSWVEVQLLTQTCGWR